MSTRPVDKSKRRCMDEIEKNLIKIVIQNGNPLVCSKVGWKQICVAVMGLDIMVYGKPVEKKVRNDRFFCTRFSTNFSIYPSPLFYRTHIIHLRVFYNSVIYRACYSVFYPFSGNPFFVIHILPVFRVR